MGKHGRIKHKFEQSQVNQVTTSINHATGAVQDLAKSIETSTNSSVFNSTNANNLINNVENKFDKVVSTTIAASSVGYVISGDGISGKLDNTSNVVLASTLMTAVAPGAVKAWALSQGLAPVATFVAATPLMPLVVGGIGATVALKAASWGCSEFYYWYYGIKKPEN